MPVTDYLQRKGLDYVKACYQISSATASLKGKWDIFSVILKAAESFANLINEKIKDFDGIDMQDIIIQT